MKNLKIIFNISCNTVVFLNMPKNPIKGGQGFGCSLTSGFIILHMVGHSLCNTFIGANFDSIWEQNRSPPSKQPPPLSLCGVQKLSLSGRQGTVCGLLVQDRDCMHRFLCLFCRKDGLLLPRTDWEHNLGFQGRRRSTKGSK